MPNVPATHKAKKLAIHVGIDAADRVETMLDRQNPNGQSVARRDFGAGVVGCLGSAKLPEHGNICFFTGHPINGPDVRELTNADSAAQLFPAYDGAFGGVFWDEQQNVLVVATDCLGMQPLYMRHDEGGLTLASDTKAMPGEPDLAAWGAFLAIGHPIGDRSLVNGVKRVPPASILTYDCAQRQLTIRRYWHWPEPSDAWQRYDFLAALEADVQSYAALGDPGTLLLSGGFDSRLLLFLLKRLGIPVDALVVAHTDEYGDADGRFAQALAALTDVKYQKRTPPADFYSSAEYLEYLSASDVGFPSLDLFIAKVASKIDGTAVWDGLVPGFVFMPLHQPDGGFAAYRREEIRGLDSATWRAAKTLFRPEVVDAMFEGFSDDLQAEIARLPQDMYGLARFVIENRSRNRAAMNPLKVYANQVNAFVPGLSKDFMTHASLIPYAEKEQGRFYRTLFERLDKRALAIPFLSGGELMPAARADARYWRERMRIALGQFANRHPSLFPGVRRLTPQRSAFLGPHLFDGGDDWLDSQARDRLEAADTNSYIAWKLLFHWKAWRWVHDGTLETMLDSHVGRTGS